MRLKGYGNAIVPLLAAEFIKAYLSIDFGNSNMNTCMNCKIAFVSQFKSLPKAERVEV